MKYKPFAYAAIVLALGGAVGLLWYQSRAVERPNPADTAAYVADAFGAIVPTWNAGEMIKRQGPYMRALDKDGMHTTKLFALFQHLGPLKEARPCKRIEVKNTFSPVEGVAIPSESMAYHCATVFTKDNAQVIMILGKEKDVWGLAGLRVYSKYIDAMVAKQSPSKSEK